MLLRLLRLAFGVLTLTAIAVNLAHAFDEVPGFVVLNFFSYFTNLSNILAACVLIVGAIAQPVSARWEAVRGLATFSMAVTGIVYAVLLAGEPLGVTDPWINTVIHKVMPVVMVLDWLLVPPRHRIERLVAEEHAIRSREERDSGDEAALAADKARLDEVAVELDRCWDLLRQRRALRAAGADPDGAAVRDADTVEHYRQ